VTAFDRDVYRGESLKAWREVAAGWEERRVWLLAITAGVNRWLVEKVDPRPGQALLEIAAGPGDLGFEIAERVGQSGRVVGVDFSPEMVEVARRNGVARGVSNVEYRVLDAEQMEGLDEGSFDGVVCRWAYMLMADPARALRETRRVLRDGGSLGFAVWTTPDKNPWAALPSATLVERGHLPAPAPGAPGMFALADPSRLRDLVTQAGFRLLELEEIALVFRYENGDDLWDSQVRMSRSVSLAINALPEDEREATRETVMQKFAPFRNDDGSYNTPGATWGVLAR
jgi:ubiquinone/menaquinone biosynthesis C-methylase UbiE